jgi:hypothetical protein
MLPKCALRRGGVSESRRSLLAIGRQFELNDEVCTVLVLRIDVWRYGSVTRVFQGCYNSIVEMLQGFYKSVTRVSQKCHKGVTKV